MGVLAHPSQLPAGASALHGFVGRISLFASLSLSLLTKMAISKAMLLLYIKIYHKKKSVRNEAHFVEFQ